MGVIEDKIVLCFGDSNTWGFNPVTGDRYPYGTRWPGVLASVLGPGFRVVEEGLNGRTTAFEDSLEEGRNGKRLLPVLLRTHAPIDLIVIMLGTNDVKPRFGLRAEDIGLAMGALADVALASGAGPSFQAPRVLLVSPPPVSCLPECFFPSHFDATSITKSQELPCCFEAVAKERGCGFFDAATAAVCSEIDGVHLDTQGHGGLGEALAGVVQEIVGRESI